MKTLQECYEIMRSHLVGQGHRAFAKEGWCGYRAPNGDMCAVGCLISDEAYQPEIDVGDMSAEGAPVVRALDKSQVPTDEEAIRFFLAAQKIHDRGYDLDFFETVITPLDELAVEFGLTPVK